jgi:methionine synthase I (cobalamin-dependent)
MHELITRLLDEAPVLLDGGWGTQMQARGLAPGECPDAWNLSAPDKVREVAAAYVAAGSRIILTNTFGATSLALEGHSLGDQAAAINEAGARLSQEAAAGKALVFGSMGPSGKMLMMGETTPDALQAAFAEQAAALKDGGADGLVIETMSDLEEAKAAIAGAKTTGLPVVACVVFDSGKDKDRTMMGATVEQAVAVLTEAGVDVVGSNCGQGIEGFAEITRRLRAATDRPLWIKANAGLPEMEDGRTVYRKTPEEFAAAVPELIKAGASFVGGCCGTTPEFIAAVQRRLSAG